MPFNINEFKAEVTNGDLLRNNAFTFLVSPPVGNADANKQLALRTETTSLPGVSFITSDSIKHYGYGPIYKRPYGVIMTDLVCTHYVDATGSIYRMFSDWMDLIVKYKRPNGVMNEGDYFMNFPVDYVTDLKVQVYDKFGTVSRTVVFLEAYPVAMDPISMSWASVDEFVRLSVTYTYTDWYVESDLIYDKENAGRFSRDEVAQQFKDGKDPQVSQSTTGGYFNSGVNSFTRGGVNRQGVRTGQTNPFPADNTDDVKVGYSRPNSTTPRQAYVNSPTKRR